MSLLIARKGEVIIGMPYGQLDTNTSPEAEKILMEQIDDGKTRIVVDFSKTDYLDSSALGMLLLLREHAGGESSDITISNTSGTCKKH